MALFFSTSTAFVPNILAPSSINRTSKLYTVFFFNWPLFHKFCLTGKGKVCKIGVLVRIEELNTVLFVSRVIWLCFKVTDYQGRIISLGYFDVLTLIPAGTLLERLRKKSWNFTTQFTHISRDCWASRLY